jgi:pimeloyl-ACP methyl ester carboxylesterase
MKRILVVLFAFVVTVFAVVPSRIDAAQVAASIDYAFIPRPAGLPDDMQPLPGATLRFLSIKALDGYTMQAALWQASGKPPAATTIFVQVHGSGANFTELPLRAIARAFSARGYAALTISTRQHDEHVNTDNFYDVRHDIEAAVATAKALGYKTIILEGHSLGTVQMEYYAATTWDAAVKGVVLTGPFGNLPWKSRNILIQNDAAYSALADASVKALRDGNAGDVLPIKMPYLGGVQSPVTAQHFLTYRDDRSSAADGTFWIRRIPYPILLARDQSDGVVLPFEPYMLLSAAHAEGSLVPSISYVIVPDTHPVSAAGHIFTDNTPALIDAVSRWLSDQHL